MKKTEEEILKKGLSQLSIIFDNNHLEKLLAFSHELERWNKRFKLVKAEPGGLLVNHILDCLSAISFFKENPENNSILDIGSGAGFPGIPLSIFLNRSSFLLAERMDKRAAFLKNIVIACKLKNVSIFQGDYKNIKETFNIITFRAVSLIKTEPEELLAKLKKDGVIIAYKGRKSKITDEINEIKKEDISIKIKEIQVPFLDKERHLLIIKKSDNAFK